MGLAHSWHPHLSQGLKASSASVGCHAGTRYPSTPLRHYASDVCRAPRFPNPSSAVSALVRLRPLTSWPSLLLHWAQNLWIAPASARHQLQLQVPNMTEPSSLPRNVRSNVSPGRKVCDVLTCCDDGESNARSHLRPPNPPRVQSTFRPAASCGFSPQLSMWDSQTVNCR